MDSEDKTINSLYPEMTTQDAEIALADTLKNHPEITVIVDFDETLWLRNSTEEYLRSLKPFWLAYIILVMLDIIRPWKVIKHPRREYLFRDWIRILACTVLMPWSLILWRRNAPSNAKLWTNRRLLAILKEAQPTQIYVATFGIDIIVRPLLHQIDDKAVLCAAGTLWSGHSIRRIGKVEWIKQRHSCVDLTNSVVVTDSNADVDLLEISRVPILVKWPEAEYRPAMSDIYVPFLYTQRAKRPGENYMLYGFFLEDVILLWLAFAWIMPSPFFGSVGLLLLHLSFWAVYELGYVENDTYAVQKEARPKIHAVTSFYAKRMSKLGAWIVSCFLGVIGITVLVLTNKSALTFGDTTIEIVPLLILSFLAWLVYVAASRLAFWVYNRLATEARSHYYVVLQLFRSIGYAVFFYISMAGAMLLLSLSLARWVKYLAYRDSGKTLKEDQRFLTLIIFAVLFTGGLAVQGFDFISIQSLVAFGWLAIYAHRRFLDFARHATIR